MKNPLKRRYIEISEEEPTGDDLNTSFDTVVISDDDDGEFSDETSSDSESEYCPTMQGKPHLKSGLPGSLFTEAVSFNLYFQNKLLSDARPFIANKFKKLQPNALYKINVITFCFVCSALQDGLLCK